MHIDKVWMAWHLMAAFVELILVAKEIFSNKPPSAQYPHITYMWKIHASLE
jgi:hypothetical protein